MKCPVCQSENIAKILYGMPAFSEELEEDLKAGKICLGGCEIWPGRPQYHCNDCKHEFSPSATEKK